MKDLKSYIVESSTRYEKIVKQSVDDIAAAAMENIYWDFLKNASDFNKCKEHEISWILNLANCDNCSYLPDDEIKNSFSIKDIIKRYGKHNCPDVVDKWVEENWDEYLDENTVEALNNFFDEGSILGKKQLNGGRWEAFRGFQISVFNSVVNKIKKNL
jgi:hypothetical protein